MQQTSIQNWLVNSTARLKSAGIATARLDCLVLLEDVLNTNRTQLLARSDQILSREQFYMLSNLVDRRARHEPLAYIRGHCEFYGRTFTVNKHVLQPRPETESMIDLAKNLPCDWLRTTIIDVGSGSGATAITAKLELPKAKVIATDIDPECLKVAKLNAKQHNCEIKFVEANLLAAIKVTDNSVVLANLPYVPNDYLLNTAASYEPKLAIFGGADGLELYRLMFAQLSLLTQRPAFVLTESLPAQHLELAQIARSSGYSLSKTEDFIQLFTCQERS
ncbi:MAG: HemK/PrmC family methyltransferase [Candidatus Saccharimonadales bacterium]